MTRLTGDDPVYGGESCGSGDYRYMAQVCATQIRDWLACRANGRRAADEWRFVAARSCLGYQRAGAQQAEAALIRAALTLLAILRLSSSNRDSVFETLEAQEMLWVLQAVMAPERENTLRSAWRHQ